MLRWVLSMVVAGCLVSPGLLEAQGIGPDVIVGDLSDAASYGTDGSGIYAYAIGTTSCNVGDEELLWIATTPEHPVIGQSIYRYEDGRFVHLGQSWLKHGFQALQGGLCTPCTPSSMGGAALGVGCSDPYGAMLNGSQGGLGPKSEVNPVTGAFPYPFTSPFIPPVIGRRVQVLGSEVDPALHPTALYFAEGQYIAADDALAGNGNNNVSYRPLTVADDANFTMNVTGSTTRELPAIFAWQEIDPEVVIRTVDIPGDGRVHVAYRVTDNLDGTWHYEYAIHNLNSHLGVRAFSLAVDSGVGMTAAGFHDVHYHSGEAYASTDWAFARTATSASWSTDTFGDDPNANALRWGTLYNVWFDSDSPPTPSAGRLTTFRPGTPSEVYFPCVAPTPSSAPAIEPPAGLVCGSELHEVSLSWTNGEAYDEIQVVRASEVVATLPGTATSYQEEVDTAGNYFYLVFGLVAGEPSPSVFCDVTVDGIGTPAGLDCSAVGDEVTLTWSNPNPYAYDSQTIVRDGVPLVTLGGDATTYVDSSVPLGPHDYEVRGVVGTYASPPATCSLLVFDGATSGSVLVFAHPQGSGSGAIATSLMNAGLTVQTEPALSEAEILANDACFVALGMYPNNHQLTPAEGQILADYVSAGGRVYLEGGDAFGFDPPTAFHDVAGLIATSDGSDDLFDLTPQSSGVGLDLTSFPQIPYTGENSWVDHLEPSVPAAGVIWRNVASSYDCGIFKAIDVYGPTIVCAFLFVGIGDGTHHDAIMQEYLSAFGINPADAPVFLRGDVNQDDTVDLGDPIALLDFLFASGAAPSCASTADFNDSSAIDIADAIFALEFLFNGGPAPALPFPDCGVDSTEDGLLCEMSACP